MYDMVLEQLIARDLLTAEEAEAVRAEHIKTGKPFQMLTVLYNDRPEMASGFLIKTGYEFPVLIDPPMISAKEYGLTGVPETFIIDTQGILREKFIGPFDWNSPAAITMINKYLPQ